MFGPLPPLPLPRFGFRASISALPRFFFRASAYALPPPCFRFRASAFSLPLPCFYFRVSASELLHPHFRFRFSFLIVATLPTNLKADDTANRFRFCFQNPGRNCVKPSRSIHSYFTSNMTEQISEKVQQSKRVKRCEAKDAEQANH